MGRRHPVRAALLPLAAALFACGPAAPASAGTVPAGDGECGASPAVIPGTPWALQRLQLAQLWSGTSHQGQHVKVAVIDSGVDNRNPQLRDAVDTSLGEDLTPKKDRQGGPANGTHDTEGHGTEVAGIIAARKAPGTGFIGIAPRATIIPIRQNAGGHGNVDSLARGITDAVRDGAKVINISQDTPSPTPLLQAAVENAVAKGVVIVASSGNDGAGGKKNTTYPAAYPGVLAVGATDRNDDRADFSQAGPFVGVAGPGVDMTSTVPGKGQCVDSGTSFSAPYVSGVAALLFERHPTWTGQQVIARIEQTADRPGRGRNDDLGWGVVDPVRAITDTAPPAASPTPDPVATDPDPVRPVAYAVDDGSQERMVRDAVYTLGLVVLLVAVLSGGAVVVRDSRRSGRGGRRQ